MVVEFRAAKGRNSALQKERLYGIEVFGDACFALAALAASKSLLEETVR